MSLIYRGRGLVSSVGAALAMDSPLTDWDDTGEGITAFFIRRDVYLSFFGPCDVVDAHTEDKMSVCDAVPDSPSTDHHSLIYSSPGSDVLAVGNRTRSTSIPTMRVA